ncbi:MAG: mannose-1-phosphate guanylyltransferase/mannose-6-phosphate isomerase [Magnetococcales bacterium]|nr:mannose-1-phosphate guanylyltransferase/mannose-6-phosphate isomerase [Magnetococcales bacterium]
MFIPVILSGGSGTRLWPLSREHYPKQFLPVLEEHSLFQSTLKRTSHIAGISPPLLVCNQGHRFLVAEQARDAGIEPLGILLEPEGRNTAPAVATAALHLAERFPDALLLVLPADHVIGDEAAFQQAMDQAATTASAGYLVTFGVVPGHAETGFGYIQKGASLPAPAPDTARAIARFVEKPDLPTAEAFLQSGQFLWNSGMFLFPIGLFLEEMARHAPEVLRLCRDALSTATRDLDFIRLPREPFLHVPSISLDHALFERTDRAAVVPLAAAWSDVGSFNSLWGVDRRNPSGNAVRGDVLAMDTTNCYLRSEHRLLATLGLNNMVVIETGDAVLVAPMDRAQEIKRLPQALRQRARMEAVCHRVVYRPWGHYETIYRTERSQVKRITVKPGAELSLQMHHHRAEHWVVVKGTARVTRGQETFILTEDQSTYISLGTHHALANPGLIPLEVIEVQTGSYLGEDDIIRFRDRYGRTEGAAPSHSPTVPTPDDSNL